jgi:hypothetical protein
MLSIRDFIALLIFPISKQKEKRNRKDKKIRNYDDDAGPNPGLFTSGSTLVAHIGSNHESPLGDGGGLEE